MTLERSFTAWETIPPPVIIGAVGGSGTRVVARILAKLGFHIGARRNPAEDSEPIMDFYNTWLQRYLECDGAWPTDQGATVAVAFQQAVAEHRRGIGECAGRWAMKVPRTLLMLPHWQAAFPAARFVHVVRNGLDMAYSADDNQLRMFQAMVLTGAEQALPRPHRAMAYWRTVNLRAADVGEAAYRERYHVLRFEDLCREPASAIARLAAFVNTKPEVAAAIAEVQPPASLDRWRRHPAEETFSLAALGRPALERFGY